jgi:hypothetical protein
MTLKMGMGLGTTTGTAVLEDDYHNIEELHYIMIGIE